MHAARLGFVNWGVRKVTGRRAEDVAGNGKSRLRTPPYGFPVSRTTGMESGAGSVTWVQGASSTAVRSGSNVEPETLAVAHHPAAAGAREMPADHEDRRAGKLSQERPAGAIGLRSIKVGRC
jgi:hypothetical protein